MNPTGDQNVTRGVVIGAIELCLGRSEVKAHVEPGTVEIYFQSHPEEVWGENEVRLKPVWDVLVGQPGLTAKEVAPPLLVLKSYEHVLGMFVSLPPELGDVPASELDRYRSALALNEHEFTDEVRRIQADVSATTATAPPAPAPAPKAPSRAEAERIDSQKTKVKQIVIAVVIGVVTLTAVGLGAMFAFRQTDATFDVSDVSSILALSKPRRDENSLIAVISDPKWETLDAAKQKETALELFTKEASKGIQSMTLFDGQGRVRVQAMDLNGDKQVAIR